MEANKIAKLEEELKAKDLKFAAMKKLLESSGLLDKNGSNGLLDRRGRPPSRPEPRRIRRELQAATVLDMAKLVQGPDLATNIATLVELAIREDPSVRDKLLETGCLPTTLVSIPDARFSCGYREEASTTLVSTKTGALYQAGTGSTSSSIKTLRKLGGTKLINTPAQLQAWMEWQPELPPIEFVRAGCSAVHVAMDSLLEKLMCNPRVRDKIRWQAPYDRGTKLVVYYMVTLILLAFTYHRQCVLNYKLIFEFVTGYGLYY